MPEVENTSYKIILHDAFKRRLLMQRLGSIKSKDLETWIFLFLFLVEFLLENEEKETTSDVSSGRLSIKNIYRLQVGDTLNYITNKSLNIESEKKLLVTILYIMLNVTYEKLEEKLAIPLRIKEKEAEDYLIRAWRFILPDINYKPIKILILSNFVDRLTLNSTEGFVLKYPIIDREAIRMLNNLGAKLSYDNNRKLIKNMDISTVWQNIKDLDYLNSIGEPPEDILEFFPELNIVSRESTSDLLKNIINLVCHSRNDASKILKTVTSIAKYTLPVLKEILESFLEGGLIGATTHSLRVIPNIIIKNIPNLIENLAQLDPEANLVNKLKDILDNARGNSKENLLYIIRAINQFDNNKIDNNKMCEYTQQEINNLIPQNKVLHYIFHQTLKLYALSILSYMAS